MGNRILQLSDPHLLADPRGRCAGYPSLPLLRHALAAADRQLRASRQPPDLLLISGDLCQDESWGGYVGLRTLLEAWPLPVALLPGNHDHPQLLRAVLGRRAVIAPALVPLGNWWLLLLDSHRAAEAAGWLGPRQLAWARRQLAAVEQPVLVALHHPPMPIGDPGMDAIHLRDGEALLELLRFSPRVKAVVFGHIHQHWQGALSGRPDLPLLGCPSTLRSFGPVQPCPLERAQDPGGRLLELGRQGEIRHRLLRWERPAPLSFDSGL